MRVLFCGSIGLTFRTMETIHLFGPEPHCDPMSYAEAFRVRTSVAQAFAPALTDPAADSGPNSPESFASFDPVTSSWRTSQLCLDGELSAYLETWPRSGLMRNGIAYRLPPLVPLTSVIVSGLLPTPTATDHKNESMTMATVMRRQSQSKRGVRVAEVFHGMAFAPTPNAGNDHWGGRLDELGGLSNPFRGTAIGKLPLNPCWQEERMGFPLGWTALDASEMP